MGLLTAIILLFGIQAQTILDKPLFFLMIAVPILLQSLLMSLLTYIWKYKACIHHNIATPTILIICSNFFELAVVMAISLFGLNSGAALATVVGVLVEVTGMIWLVSIANRSVGRFRHV